MGRGSDSWLQGHDLRPWRGVDGWGRGRKFQAMCFTLRHADKVLANSDFTRDTLISLIGVPPERIAVIYPTVDIEGMQPGLPHDDLLASLGLGGASRLFCP